MSKPTCVLVTHLNLSNLKSRSYGSLMRLRTLAAAAVEAGFDLVMCASLSGSELRGGLGSTSAELQRELRDAWSIDARVEVALRSALPETSWLGQQLAGVWSYDKSWFARSCLAPDVMRMIQRELDAQPALVIAQRLPSMTAVRALAPRIPVVFDLDDVEHRVLLRSVPKQETWRDRVFALASVPALYLAERRAASCAALTLVCSNPDADLLRRFLAHDQVCVMPNAVEMPLRAASNHKPVLLMVGIYSYGPNGDGAEYFVREIFPRIAASNADAEAWFAGANPQSVPSAAAAPERVRFLGFVDSLEEVYDTASVVVCPIRYGGGTRVKLVEAAAWGKAIVTTTVGAEGLEMRDGEHALFADTPESFAAACQRLLDDQELRGRLGANARRLAERLYKRENVAAQMGEQLIRVARQSRQPR